MFYRLLFPLRDFWFGFNVFKYITFRTAMAGITAFVISIMIGPFIIKWLKALNLGQSIRKKHVEALYDLHKHKEGVPTMGGIIIILSILISTVLWADILNRYVILSLCSMMWLGAIGFIDDYVKISKKRNLGLRATTKFSGQIILGIVVAIYLFLFTPMPRTLYMPFFKTAALDLGVFYVLFVILVLAGSSNAVNLTDGLDGLAVGCTVIAALTYVILSYITGHVVFSDYLNVFNLTGTGELSIFCASLVGAGLGFLWFNSHPATVFMGDTGSLALGGAIGIVALLIKKELLLFLVGGIFVLEAVSVLLQVASFKLTKKRIFLMTPLHHHFQLLGWPESKITIRFWIVAIILALLSLATLKLQ